MNQASPNVVNLRSQAYHARKKARRDRQQAILDQVLALPEREALELLFKTWPDHLPKITRGKLPARLRSRWLHLNKLSWMQRNFSEELDEIFELHQQDYLLHMAHHAQARHQQRLDALLGALAQSVRGEATVSIDVSAPVPGLSHRELMLRCNEDPSLFDQLSVRSSLHAHYKRVDGQAVFVDCQGQEMDHEVHLWLALGLDTTGALTMTETLPLRRMVKDEQGNDTWVNQLKSYCVSMIMGEWEGLSPQDAAWAYNTDPETGLPRNADPGRSFGQVKRPGWLNRTPPHTAHLE